MKWKAHWTAAVWSIYAFVTFEWLFFATKASFMSDFDAIRKTVVLAVTPLAFLLPALAWVGLLASLSRAGSARPWSAVWAMAARIPATLALAALLLLWIDSFTHTVLGFGITRASPPWVWGYAPIVMLLVVASWRGLSKLLPKLGGTRAWWTALVPVVASLLVFAVSSTLGTRLRTVEAGAVGIALERRPNVLIIGSDGLNAENMSCYGYERDTTPFLRKMAGEACYAKTLWQIVPTRRARWRPSSPVACRRKRVSSTRRRSFQAPTFIGTCRR